MLRKIRLTLAVLSLTLVTLLFLDFTGTVHAWFSWLARIQFLPAVLALHVEIVVALVVLTLLFGRVYCSVVCRWAFSRTSCRGSAVAVAARKAAFATPRL